jgi:hypothetical protein
VSLEESVVAVMRFLPEALLSPASAQRIAETARWFPDALSPQFGFECRLIDDSRTVDFIMRVTLREGGAAILAGMHPNIRLAEQLTDHIAWQRIRDFCVCWANAGSSINRHTQSLWLEFDTSTFGNPPVPGVFFNISNLESINRASTKTSASNDNRWVLETAIPLLRDPLTGGVAQRLARCFDCPNGHVLQIGLFPGRAINAVRLFIYAPSSADLLSYLDHSDWPGDLRELQAAINPLFEIGDQIYLDLDIGDVTYPKIGIECQFDDLRQPGQEPRWRRLLDYLVDSGVCTDSKREGLLSFPGSSVENFIYQRVFFRGLHHIKLVYQPGRPLEAKAYLGGRHQPAAMVSAAPHRQAREV